MKELTDKKKIEAERSELNLLISKGVFFTVERDILIRRKGLSGFFRKRITKSETLRFKINEPTLATLDRLSAEQIDLQIDENVMSSDLGISEAKKLTNQHCRRLARIIALAVLGNDYMKAPSYIPDDKALEKLITLFFHSIKPSKLMQLVVLINTMSNLGDFCNSIRLLSAERTTMPIRIEAKEG